MDIVKGTDQDMSAASEDSGDLIEEEEEVLLYLDFPDFEDTTIVTNANEIKVAGIMSGNPKCTIDNLDFVGKHEVHLGSYLASPPPR